MKSLKEWSTHKHKKTIFIQLHWISYFLSVKGRSKKQSWGVMIIKQLLFTLPSVLSWFWKSTDIVSPNFFTYIFWDAKSNENTIPKFEFCIVLNNWICFQGSGFIFFYCCCFSINPGAYSSITTELCFHFGVYNMLIQWPSADASLPWFLLYLSFLWSLILTREA